MSPPPPAAAAVEIASPIETIPSFLNPTFYTESNNQPNMEPLPSSFSIGFGEKTKSRPKPRLVKLRKNIRNVKVTSVILTGFNPFVPTGSNVKELPVDNKGFVFGANENSGGNATVSDEEEFSTPIGRFDSGSGDKRESIRPVDESRSCEVNLADEMEKLNISDDTSNVNGCNNGPTFIFGGNNGKVEAECKGEVTSGLSGECDTADKTPTVHSETTNISNLTSTTFDDFNVPEWDPSILKNSLFPPEVNRNPRGSRLSEDKRSKNVKEKTKPYKPKGCNNDQASVGIESQEKSGSPMDFSPYRGEKPSNQIPTETLTSVTTEPVFSFSASSTFHATRIRNKKLQTLKKYRRVFPRNNLNNATMHNNNQENQQPVNTEPISSSSSTIPDVCEVWRLRGNQAYKNGDMCKAEECYTHGINSEHSTKPPLVLCYANRAAARISLGRLREAIVDCVMAVSLDPNYTKAFMRSANCHLVLGELESAVECFNKCMESASSVCLDRQTVIESAEGLQQAQRVTEYTNSASILLEKRTFDGASDALVQINNALSISSCSEKLLRMKADALFMIRCYKEAIELCESTIQTAGRNCVSGSKDNYSLLFWRSMMISKSHFYLGNLEVALELLEKLQEMGSNSKENHHEESRDSLASLMTTISELLRYKNAGNEAVRAGKYMEAIEQYTAALSKNVDSRPFAAICFCNRAAANQALSQISDAIADCSLAMALDESYTKALSRRATLHEMIRDYEQAASDLQRLISILVKQSSEKETSVDRGSIRKELKQTRQRLSLMEEKSKEDIPLDFFLIMGVKVSDSAADIKKAYRKAALKHHPDKAAQILVRSESEGPWLKEILEDVHKGADRLFKMIGEAYSVLSDPTKRSNYEMEEEIRKARASRNRGNKKSAETSSPSYQSSPSRHYWRESRRTYQNTPSWW